MKTKQIALAIPCIIFISGCATSNLDKVFRPGTIALEGQIHADRGDSAIKEVELAKIIWQDSTNGSSSIDNALVEFRNKCSYQCEIKRNSIQDRLIAASNAICAEYKWNLKQVHANTNLSFGGASTILGGIGALAQTTNPARLFSGAASIASGLRAEYNQNIYSMLAVEVITKAIDKARNDKLKDIDVNQKSLLRSYSLDRAIADAITYHEKCSLISGLEEASSAVSLSDNIGLKSVNKTLTDLGITTNMSLGKGSYTPLGKDSVFIVASCKGLTSKYSSLLELNKIDIRISDFTKIDSKWKNSLSKSICNNSDSTKSEAADLDKAWIDNVSKYIQQSDPKEQETILLQIKSQQTTARAKIDVIEKDLEATGKEYEVKRIAISEFENAASSLKSGIDTFNKSDSTSKLSNLSKVAELAKICIEKSKQTEVYKIADSGIKLQTEIDKISKLPATSAEDQIKAAALSLVSEINSSWKTIFP